MVFRRQVYKIEELSGWDICYVNITRLKNLESMSTSTTIFVLDNRKRVMPHETSSPWVLAGLSLRKACTYASNADFCTLQQKTCDQIE